MRLPRQVSWAVTAPRQSRLTAIVPPSAITSCRRAHSSLPDQQSPIPDDALRSFASSSSSRVIPDPSDFFNSSRPTPPHISALPAPPTSLREQYTFKRLEQLLTLPPSERDALRSRDIWQMYKRLSPSFRRSLPLETLQNVFRSVLPNTHEVLQLLPNGNGIGQNPLHFYSKERSRRDTHLLMLGGQWEMRLRTITSDLLASYPDQIDLTMFIPALRKLAFVGDRTGCEAITNEIRHRYEGTDRLSPRLLRKMYNIGLKSVSQWLFLSATRWKHQQPEILSAIETTKRLVLAIQHTGRSPTPFTAKALLSTARHVSDTCQDQEMRDAFDALAGTILKDGYGLDLDALVWDNDIVKNHEHVRLAVIHHLGRKGKLYHMLAAFDAMYPPVPSSTPALSSPAASKPTSTSTSTISNNNGEQEEFIPTLSAMLEAERADRANRSWFGRSRVVQDQDDSEIPVLDTTIVPSTDNSVLQIKRKFSDFLSPIPTPLELRSKIHSLSTEHIKRLSPEPSSFIYSTPPAGVPDQSTISAMLQHTWRVREQVDPNQSIYYKQVAVHTLQIALRSAHEEQARWLSDIFTSGRNGKESDPPALRIQAEWFTAAWRIVRSSGTGRRAGRQWYPSIMAALEESLDRNQQEQVVLTEALARLTDGSLEGLKVEAVAPEMPLLAKEEISSSTVPTSTNEVVSSTVVADEATQPLLSTTPNKISVTSEDLATRLYTQLDELLSSQSKLEEIEQSINSQAQISLIQKQEVRQRGKVITNERKHNEKVRNAKWLKKDKGLVNVKVEEKEKVKVKERNESHWNIQGQGQGQTVLA